jgi:hypothetical protein
MQENAVAVTPSAAHIGTPHGAASLIYFRNFAFDRLGTLWQWPRRLDFAELE